MHRLDYYKQWPAFSYENFQPSSHLLHMLIQAIGKLKLIMPFEPEWSNVSLWVTSQGITTGLIPYKNIGFSVSMNFISHQVICNSSNGRSNYFNLASTSVADIVATLFDCLKFLGIDITVNPKPQEVPNPIAFFEDTKQRIYNPEVVNAWWRILVSSQFVMQKYHAQFIGKTPPIALMWGTLDLRDVRFNGELVKPTGINSGYLRRNAMDEKQVETGWWGGNELYPYAAYYSFTYPQPEQIESANIKPEDARWNNALSEFILHYDDVYKAKDPEEKLFTFFESTYRAGANLAHWNSKLIGLGRPI